MPYAKYTIKTSKSQEAIKSALQKSFDVSNDKEQLKLSLKREGGNLGFIRVLFPKIKTYLKKEDGKAKCTMKMEWVGAIMLFVSMCMILITYFTEATDEESVPLWMPIALTAWYLIYSFVSISKSKKLLQVIEKN